MATLEGIRPFGINWAEAEKFCDEWAGDNQAHAVVVEEFKADTDSIGELLVMDASRASSEYLLSHDAEIKYDADHTVKP